MYQDLLGCVQTSYMIQAGSFKVRPDNLYTQYGNQLEHASPEQTQRLIANMVDWYSIDEKEGMLILVELAGLFHCCFIRTCLIEDGNGPLLGRC